MILNKMKYLLCVFLLTPTLKAKSMCDKREAQIINVISVIDQLGVDPKTSELKLQDAEISIDNGSFCNSIFPAYVLCHSLTRSHYYFKLETKDPSQQDVLEKALRELGALFPSTDEADGFGCDLKTLIN